jgi:hypothetical protein
VTVERSYGEAPVLEVWAEDSAVVVGASARIHARVRAPAGALRVERVTLQALRRGGSVPEPAVAMTPAPEGFSAVLRTDPGWAPVGEGAPPLVDFSVSAEGSLEGRAFTRDAQGTFRVHAPGARVEEARVQVASTPEGITVRLPVTVTVAGTYGLYGELWGGGDGRVPVAFARERFPGLTPGPREVTLTFGQGVLRDGNVRGPFVLRNVRWSHAAAVPPHEQRLSLERVVSQELR